MDMKPIEVIWKSYVFYKGKCVFVSTIKRDYETCQGRVRGFETIVWEYDYEKAERGDIIHQAGGITDHQRICRCFIAEGVMPDEDNPKHERFFK